MTIEKGPGNIAGVNIQVDLAGDGRGKGGELKPRQLSSEKRADKPMPQIDTI
jgi:hypothetical protein